MPVYTIETPSGRRLKIEAADEATAMRGAQEFEAGQAQPQAAPKGQGHNVPEYVPPGVEGYDPKTGMVERGGGISDRIGAFVTGAADIPVAGPLAKAGIAGAAAGMAAPFSDQPFGDIYGQMRGRQEQVMRENPSTALAGQIVGGTAALAPIGATATGARMLGMAGSLPARMGMSAVSGGALSAADTAVRGGSAADVIGSGVIGASIGGAIPGVGAGLRAGYGAAKDRIGGAIRGAVNPSAEAGRRVASAIKIDQKTPGATMSRGDFAAAGRNNQPLLNADLGGETTRALARAAANQSPEARGVMQRAVQDRFYDQGNRVVRLVNRLTGNKADDLMAVDMIKDMAAAQNAPAYNKAFGAPAAQAMFTKDLQQLMQAPAIQQAVRDSTSRGANRAAAAGFKAVKNPFVEAADGTFKLKRRADGSIIAPTLEFWNQVKINLDSAIGVAKRTGDNPYTSDLMALKTKLVNTLDNAVPEYKAARTGAAKWFGAEDAVEAGRTFAKSSRMLPEFNRGILALKNGAEKEAFEIGFASELIDAAKSAGDSTNVVSRMFRSPEARQKMEMAFGKARAQEIEAFVRVEVAMDQLRNAFGNSTTARQLIEAGVIGGGAAWYTGDFNTGVTAAALTVGARAAGRKIDGNVMTKTAEMLMSNDPQIIAKAVQNAAVSPAHMAAIDALTQIAGAAARSGNLAIAN
jgi:hypothetical protein